MVDIYDGFFVGVYNILEVVYDSLLASVDLLLCYAVGLSSFSTIYCSAAVFFVLALGELAMVDC